MLRLLNGDLAEEVYMVQPEGFKEDGESELVCRLMKSIYSLKQVSRQWFLKFDEVITFLGFVENNIDQCIYLKVSGSKFIILVLYVDDILLASSDVGLLHETKLMLSKTFDMKDLGEASFVLGIEIHRDRSRHLLVGVLSRYQSNPDLEHWVAAKKVMRHLQRTKDFMLVYRKVDHLELIDYSDSDFASCKDDLKSTSGYTFMLARGAVSWKNSKKTITASSTMQAEFVAYYGAPTQGIWLKNMIICLGVVDSISRPLTIYCDNSSAMFFSKNNNSSALKTIDIKYLATRDLVKKRDIVFEYIETNKMLADPLT
ncbi:Retrovirus-related Pol polyprotein from transposon TNT 1-94 [Quillaja saponaria]|uniref:Retrovirus-related Pol polyprotein from transposon TNT 1-94 n=1 Tax=Quillaja saponaria TaxID=32244 RepID=A0AAD7QGY3_QUISA|nr:Retrovirus-related Pol polyprotein from transposon TNT 1-94 [Quillaja saponaria]